MTRNGVARYGWLALGFAIVAAILFRTSLVDAYVTSKAKTSQSQSTLGASESGDAASLDDAVDQSDDQHNELVALASVPAGAGSVWVDDGTWNGYDACSQFQTRMLSESGELTTVPIDLCESGLHRQNLLAHQSEIPDVVMPSYFMPGPHDDFSSSSVAAADTAAFSDVGAATSSPEYLVSRSFHGVFAGSGRLTNGTSGGSSGGSSGSGPSQGSPNPDKPKDSNPPAGSNPPGGVNPPVDSNPPVDTNPPGDGNPPGDTNPPEDNDPPGDTNPPEGTNPDTPVDDPLDPGLPIDPPPATTVPEPGTFGLLGLALVGAFLARRRPLLSRSV